MKEGQKKTIYSHVSGRECSQPMLDSGVIFKCFAGKVPVILAQNKYHFRIPYGQKHGIRPDSDISVTSH